jgi:hypothetical protein
MILEAAGSDEKGFDLFFKLLKEFQDFNDEDSSEKPRRARKRSS